MSLDFHQRDLFMSIFSPQATLLDKKSSLCEETDSKPLSKKLRPLKIGLGLLFYEPEPECSS